MACHMHNLSSLTLQHCCDFEIDQNHHSWYPGYRINKGNCHAKLERSCCEPDQKLQHVVFFRCFLSWTKTNLDYLSPINQDGYTWANSRTKSDH